MGSALTERQAAILQYILERVATDGYPPTIREIGGHFGIRSPNGVKCHLDALEKKGAIRRGRVDFGRSIRVAGRGDFGDLLPPRPPAAELLPPRQSRIYEYIRVRFAASGAPPTFREIMGELGITSPNGVVCHLKALEKKGLIRRAAGLSRAITIVG